MLLFPAEVRKVWRKEDEVLNAEAASFCNKQATSRLEIQLPRVSLNLLLDPGTDTLKHRIL